MSSTTLTSVAFLSLSYVLYRGALLVYESYTSPMRYLPGPKNSSLIWGNMREIAKADNSVLHEQWIQEFGHVIKYKFLFGIDRLFTTDHKAINHILMNDFDYQKPEPARWQLGRILGYGVLVVEGEEHKKQRRIMNPAFGNAQIRELTPIFNEKSVELQDIWNGLAAKTEDGVVKVDVLSWLSRLTLDVIGLAGFNYKFDSLGSDKPSELNSAFSTLFQATTGIRVLGILQSMVPISRRLPWSENGAAVRQAQAAMTRIGRQLLNESKASLNGTGEKGNNWKARDLLSLLVRANMASDLPAHQRLSDEDVLAQIATFLVAGHETTSTGTTWALFALSQDKRVQSKLREELLTIQTDNPTMDELNSLTYLDYVVREVLRVHCPVPSTIRIAMKDDILPLSKPFVDTKGNVHDSIKVTKGQTLFIPILVFNRDKAIWGEDASEFKPERWASVPEAVNTIPGVWGNMMTFLGGARACIGYRFSLVEMKSILFTLVRSFEFDLAVPVEDVKKKSSVVQRPVLNSDPTGTNQLPLLIKPYIV